MARPRQPTNVLKLRGSFKTHPERKRASEPEAVGPIGDPPPDLSELERACWLEIVSLCHRDVLCSADRLVVEHGARLLAMMRERNWAVHPTIMVRWERVLASLGMTPADRSRVSALKTKQDDEDPYAEFRQA